MFNILIEDYIHKCKERIVVHFLCAKTMSNVSKILHIKYDFVFVFIKKIYLSKYIMLLI